MKSQLDFVMVSSPNFFQILIVVQQARHFPDVCIHYMNKLRLVKNKKKALEQKS